MYTLYLRIYTHVVHTVTVQLSSSVHTTRLEPVHVTAFCSAKGRLKAQTPVVGAVCHVPSRPGAPSSCQKRCAVHAACACRHPLTHTHSLFPAPCVPCMCMHCACMLPCQTLPEQLGPKAVHSAVHRHGTYSSDLLFCQRSLLLCCGFFSYSAAL